MSGNRCHSTPRYTPLILGLGNHWRAGKLGGLSMWILLLMEISTQQWMKNGHVGGVTHLLMGDFVRTTYSIYGKVHLVESGTRNEFQTLKRLRRVSVYSTSAWTPCTRDTCRNFVCSCKTYSSQFSDDWDATTSSQMLITDRLPWLKFAQVVSDRQWVSLDFQSMERAGNTKGAVEIRKTNNPNNPFTQEWPELYRAVLSTNNSLSKLKLHNFAACGVFPLDWRCEANFTREMKW